MFYGTISKKYLYKLGAGIPVPNFSTLWKKTYSICTSKPANFPICFWQSQRKFFYYALSVVYYRFSSIDYINVQK